MKTPFDSLNWIIFLLNQFTFWGKGSSNLLRYTKRTHYLNMFQLN